VTVRTPIVERSGRRQSAGVAVRVRPAGPVDDDLLAQMLVAAACWRLDGPVGDVQSVLARPELAHYVSGWPRPGDLGVVAEDGPPVGAAWLRLLPEHDRGYGFDDAETPELSIGVVPTHRGRGIGSLLLEALVVSARAQRHEALSLSVEPDNPVQGPWRRGRTRSGHLYRLVDFGVADIAEHPSYEHQVRRHAAEVGRALISRTGRQTCTLDPD